MTAGSDFADVASKQRLIFVMVTRGTTYCLMELLIFNDQLKSVNKYFYTEKSTKLWSRMVESP
jgi:hypothetical protein